MCSWLWSGEVLWLCDTYVPLASVIDSIFSESEISFPPPHAECRQRQASQER